MPLPYNNNFVSHLVKPSLYRLLHTFRFTPLVFIRLLFTPFCYKGGIIQATLFIVQIGKNIRNYDKDILVHINVYAFCFGVLSRIFRRVFA